MVHPRDTEEACPSCGRYYVLTITAPPLPGYHAARAEMGNMAMSLERDPQMESLLEGRKKQLGISMDFDSGMRLGRQLALSHGLGRGRSIGL